MSFHVPFTPTNLDSYVLDPLTGTKDVLKNYIYTLLGGVILIQNLPVSDRPLLIVLQ